MTVTLPLPFRASRQLGRGNTPLVDPGVALDVVGLEVPDELERAWRRRIKSVAEHLGWPTPRCASVRVAGVVTLSFTTPPGLWRTAREANEWALCASLNERDPCHWSALRESLRASLEHAQHSDPDRRCAFAEIAERPALARLQRLAHGEQGTG
jgi:hypothetical protein